MTKTKDELEEEKASEALQKIIDILRDSKLRIPELVLLYGNLGYSIGSSIEGYTTENMPSMDELQKKYYESPTVGIAFMLQGLMTTTWKDDLLKKIPNINK